MDMSVYDHHTATFVVKEPAIAHIATAAINWAFYANYKGLLTDSEILVTFCPSISKFHS